MVLAYFKSPKVFITAPGPAFNNRYKEEWLTSEMGRKIVKEIDKSEVLGRGNAVESPVLGVISPERLSGGAKALMLTLNTDIAISSICFGDNCSELLLQISEEKDIKLIINHMLSLNDTVGKTRQIYFPELKVYAKDERDYIGIAIRNMRRMKYV